MRYALLVFLAALLFAILCATGGDAAHSEAGRGEPGSVYVPPCLDLHPKPRSQEPNGILLMTGPGRDKENRLIIGYLRRVRPDLSLGFQVQGTDKGGYEGWALGLTYHFGDPE